MSVFLIILGIYGAVFSWAQTERSRMHIERAKALPAQQAAHWARCRSSFPRCLRTSAGIEPAASPGQGSARPAELPGHPCHISPSVHCFTSDESQPALLLYCTALTCPWVRM